MKLNDISAHLGISQKALAEYAGTSPQGLNQYMTGHRGKPSEVIARVLEVSGLNREEIFFSNPFDHPAGNDLESPVYWAALALDALHEAAKRGLPEQEAEIIAEKIRAAVAPFVAD